MTTRIKRYILLLVMTVLTAGSILLFPRIIINEDMTRYLPDDSRMKEGVDILKRYFPDVDMNAYYVKAMFAGVEDTDARGRELLSVEGVDGITAESEKDGFILYQLSVREGADPKAIAARIREAYGDRVVVEHNANSIMPDNMVLILIIGVVVVFGILFLMCSSIMEALLFIVSIGMSVIMNMGTNAFLPSVSMMTNTIVAVLQLVLSMDYSIILMNRFRQVSSTEADIDRAMSLALKSASPSIIGSSLTTIVGLLVLVFMKFRIGTDLGLVLAKGVFFSLVSIYTILPTLILIFYKAVRKTEKRVFLMPTDALARFELKARIPLAIVFLAIFSSSFFLSKRTELSYASIWESRINEVFPPQNSFSLLYRTEDEDRTIVLTDTLSSDPKVLMAIGYPSLFKKELTAHQMCGNIKSILAILPNLPGAEKQDIAFDTSFLTAENISFLYYAMTHPERDEKMSFEDMIALASEASAEGLLPEGMDVESMIARFTPPEEEVVGAEFGTGDSPVPSANDHLVPADSGTAVQNDSLIAEKTEQMEPRQSLADIAKPEVDESGEDPYKLHGKYKFTKEDLHKPMNTLEMAEYLGFSKSQASAAYTMARKRNGTMTPDEFIDYMIEKVLGSKLLSRMISAKQAEGLYYIREQMDAVLSAPEEVPALAEELTPDTSDPTLQESMEAGNDHEAGAVDDRQIPDGMADGFPPDWEQKVKIPDSVPTPMERLAMMYSSGRKYSSKQICCALHDAGIDVVDQAAIDLMFMYYGSRKNPQDTTRASMDAIIDFLSTTVARDGTYSAFLPDSVRTMLGGIREMVDDNMKMIRNEDWSMEPIVRNILWNRGRPLTLWKTS